MTQLMIITAINAEVATEGRVAANALANRIADIIDHMNMLDTKKAQHITITKGITMIEDSITKETTTMAKGKFLLQVLKQQEKTTTMRMAKLLHKPSKGGMPTYGSITCLSDKI